MVRLGWTYTDLMLCPSRHLAAVVEVLNEGANANGE